MAHDPYFAGGGSTTSGMSGPRLRVTRIGATPHLLRRKTWIYFRLTRPARVWMRIKNSKGQIVRHRLRGVLYDGGGSGLKWPGKSDRFRRVPPGRYKIVLLAKKRSGATAWARTRVRVG
jgi:hypothetical protein